jgi:hypothetical protein
LETGVDFLPLPTIASLTDGLNEHPACDYINLVAHLERDRQHASHHDIVVRV